MTVVRGIASSSKLRSARRLDDSCRLPADSDLRSLRLVMSSTSRRRSRKNRDLRLDAACTGDSTTRRLDDSCRLSADPSDSCRWDCRWGSRKNRDLRLDAPSACGSWMPPPAKDSGLCRLVAMTMGIHCYCSTYVLFVNRQSPYILTALG